MSENENIEFAGSSPAMRTNFSAPENGDSAMENNDSPPLCL
jgi:hypothetical protein